MRFGFGCVAACAAIAGLATCGVRAVGQQPATADARPAAAATLPESNEAQLLAAQVDAAVQRGDYRLAIRGIVRMMELSGELVAAPASRTYYPLWRQAVRLLEQLPPDGQRVYRDLYDAEAMARFNQAAKAGDLAALRDLFNVYRVSSIWPIIGDELAARLLDAGGCTEALEVLREMSAAGVENRPARQAKLVVALGGVGAWEASEKALAKLAADAERGNDVGWVRRAGLLHDWLASQQPRAATIFAPQIAPHDDGLVSSPGFPTTPVSGQAAAELWSETLAPLPAGYFDDDPTVVTAINTLRRLPLHEPAIADDVLVVRLRGTVFGFDAVTLTPLWRVDEVEPPTTDAQAAGLRWTEDVPAGEGEVSSDAHRLLEHALRHVLSTGFGLVFTVEALRAAAVEDDFFGRRVPWGMKERAVPNELVARELRTGRLAWRAGHEPTDPLYGVAFHDAPLVVGQALVVPVRRDEELHVCVLDPADGRLIREVSVVGPPLILPERGGRCQVTTDETAIYVCTGNGVVAALRRDLAELAERGGSAWKWATVYPSTLGEYLGPDRWGPESLPREPAVDRPVLADDVLVVAPLDSRDIFALDRHTGRERWRVPRDRYEHLLGAVAAGVVVGANGLTCLDLSDGRTVRWRSVPLELTGRPALLGNRVYVPTREGVCVLDGSTGKIVDDQWVAATRARWGPSTAGGGVPGGVGTAPTPTDLEGPAAGGFAANLIATPEALWAVTPNRVVKYPDPQVLRARCEELLRVGRDVERARLALACVYAQVGEYAAALENLEALQPADPALVAARERLLVAVMVGLSSAAYQSGERLEWLRRARGLASTPETAVRLAVLIGAALEEGGHWSEALGHYAEMLRREDLGSGWDPADANRRAAAWLLALERLRAGVAHLSPQDADAFLDELLSTASNTDVSVPVLRRVALLLGDERHRDEIDRVLLLRDLPPELALECLSAEDEQSLPEPLRRRLHLERWETHVALGMLAEAAADRAYWQEHFTVANAAQSPSDMDGGQCPPYFLDVAQPLSVWGWPVSQPTSIASRVGTAHQTVAAPDTTAEQQVGWALPTIQQQRRVESIERAFRKLELGTAPPFTQDFGRHRQWKLADVELIVDARYPLRSLRPWILARGLRGQQLLLCSVNVNGPPLRETVDAVSRARADGADEGDIPQQVLWANRLERPQALRPAWPALVHGHLAAVPVHGGLVCVGLGPERRAGRRLWAYELPDWADIPADLDEMAATGPHGVYLAPRANRVMLIGWWDGQLWWQRDLPGISVRSLHLVEDVLIVVGRDGQALALDAMSGRRLCGASLGGGAVRAVDVIGDVLVVWGEDAVFGLKPTTLEPAWTRPVQGISGWSAVSGRDWVAYRERGDTSWEILAARSGTTLFTAVLIECGEITALTVADDRLLAAARVPAEDAPELTESVELAAFDFHDGRRLWRQSLPTLVPVNVTQLAAHREFVPLLVLRPMPRERTAPDPETLAILLLDKRTGQASEPVAINQKQGVYTPFERREAWSCDVYMLATPTRMIVQAAGNVVAFGNSLSGRSP